MLIKYRQITAADRRRNIARPGIISQSKPSQASSQQQPQPPPADHRPAALDATDSTASPGGVSLPPCISGAQKGKQPPAAAQTIRQQTTAPPGPQPERRIGVLTPVFTRFYHLALCVLCLPLLSLILNPIL